MNTLSIGVAFPRHESESAGEYTLKFVNQLTDSEVSIEGLRNTSSSPLLYRFAISASNLPIKGEYKYIIINDDKEIDSGIISYMDEVDTIKEYNKEIRAVVYEG